MEFDIHTAVIPLTNINVEAFFMLYGNLAVFIGALLVGEFAVLAAFILSTQEILSPLSVFGYSVLGIATADLFWYVFGCYFSKKKPGWHLHDQSIIAKTATFWEHMIGKNLFISLLVVKFLYGIRWATIVFLGLKRIPFPFFFVFDILGILFFVGVLFVIGWLTGKGIYNLMPLYHGAIGVIVAALVAFVLVHFLHIVFHKKIKNSKKTLDIEL